MNKKEEALKALGEKKYRQTKDDSVYNESQIINRIPAGKMKVIEDFHNNGTNKNIN